MIWSIEEARKLIHIIQPEVKEFGYHVTLGGSVLNNGESSKDLDLFFLKLNNVEENKEYLYDYLKNFFGPLAALRDSPDYHIDNSWNYREMVKANYNGKRIDLFIQ